MAWIRIKIWSKFVFKESLLANLYQENLLSNSRTNLFIFIKEAPVEDNH